MQWTVHVLMVASLATAFLIARVMVEPRGAAGAPVFIPTPTEVSAQPAQSFATVVKPFGASLRVAPSLDAVGLYNVSCGTSLTVLAVQSGWVKVKLAVGAGWVAASRVAVDAVPIVVDCPGRRFLSATTEAWTFAPAGCLSLRARPTDDAAELACVGNGHIYSVVDGPFDPGTGEDWFKVTSPTTGTGWALADHLYPL